MQIDLTTWNWEMIIGISGTVIALCALLATFWQMRATRRHNELSVQPILNSSYNSNFESRSIRIKLRNNGFGPAIIDSFCVEYQDIEIIDPENPEPIKRLFSDVLVELVGSSAFSCKVNYVKSSNSVMVGSELNLVEVTLDPMQIGKTKFYQVYEHFKSFIFTIDYHSLYMKPHSHESL